MVGSFRNGVLLPAVLVLALLVGAALVLLAPDTGHRALGFAGAWFFAILRPEFQHRARGEPRSMAEHRMYLPLAAVVAVVVLAAHAWIGRKSGPILAAAAGRP